MSAAASIVTETTRQGYNRIMGRKVCGLFAIDARSLATFRVAVGTIVLVDVAIRAGDFAAHYTEAGVLPLTALRETLNPATWRWSIYVLSAADWWPAVLMGLTAVCGTLLVLGLATRVATAATWVLLLSIHNRVPVIINAGDTLLHVLLLWALFLPLSGRWSIDAWLRKRAAACTPSPSPQKVCSPASAAILLQVVLLYVAAGVYKLGNDDWWSGLSLYYVMSFDAYARPAAAWMLQFPHLLKLLTWGTVALEIGGPVAAFSPWQTAPIRVLVIAFFVAFHLGIEATMTVGLFSWVSAAAWLLFLPTAFWDRLAARKTAAAPLAAGIWRDPTTNQQKVRRATSLLPSVLRSATGVLVVALLALTVHWNLAGLPYVDQKWRPAWCRAIMDLTGLRQRWRMFTRPPKHDGWPRAVAELADGTQWDLLEDKPGFDWKRRELPSTMAPNHRWRKYYSVLMRSRYDHLRPYFCRYLAGRYEAKHERPIKDVLLYQVQEITGEPGEDDHLIRRLLHREVVSSHGAFLDAAERVEQEDFEIHPGI